MSTEKIVNSLYYGDLRVFHSNPENIHPDAAEKFKYLVEKANNGYFQGIYEDYEVNSLNEVLFLEIYHMALSNTQVKKCGNCGKYFVVKNLNVEYCDRRIDNDEKSEDIRTCSDVGPKITYKKKFDEDLLLK
jgi:hypothetical protein